MLFVQFSSLKNLAEAFKTRQKNPTPIFCIFKDSCVWGVNISFICPHFFGTKRCLISTPSHTYTHRSSESPEHLYWCSTNTNAFKRAVPHLCISVKENVAAFLAVQWLALCTLTLDSQVWTLIQELRSYKPCGPPKKQTNYSGILPKSWHKREKQSEARADIWLLPWTIQGRSRVAILRFPVPGRLHVGLPVKLSLGLREKIVWVLGI